MFAALLALATFAGGGDAKPQDTVELADLSDYLALPASGAAANRAPMLTQASSAGATE